MLSMLKKEKINAMKAKDKIKMNVINDAINQINNKAIAKKTNADEISETEIVEILKKMKSQRQDSEKDFKKGGRDDLAEKEAQERLIIESFLPQMMNEEQTKALIDEAVEQTQAKTVKEDMGNVMAYIKKRSNGLVDMKKAQSIVTQMLS